jgi:hypothetical protein
MNSLIIEDNNEKNKQGIDEINNLINENPDKNVFLFVYMDGCGPCNSTIPQWDNIPRKLKQHDKHRHDIVTLRINKDLFPLLKNMGSEPMGYPSLRHVSKNGVEEFEDWQSPSGVKDRSTSSFVEWIEDKISKKKGVKKQRGGKWSIKYKKSINCRRPKGFSQRQHCKYGRKHKTRKTRKHK